MAVTLASAPLTESESKELKEPKELSEIRELNKFIMELYGKICSIERKLNSDLQDPARIADRVRIGDKMEVMGDDPVGRTAILFDERIGKRSSDDIKLLIDEAQAYINVQIIIGTNLKKTERLAHHKSALEEFSELKSLIFIILSKLTNFAMQLKEMGRYQGKYYDEHPVSPILQACFDRNIEIASEMLRNYCLNNTAFMQARLQARSNFEICYDEWSKKLESVYHALKIEAERCADPTKPLRPTLYFQCTDTDLDSCRVQLQFLVGEYGQACEEKEYIRRFLSIHETTAELSQQCDILSKALVDQTKKIARLEQDRREVMGFPESAVKIRCLKVLERCGELYSYEMLHLKYKRDRVQACLSEFSISDAGIVAAGQRQQEVSSAVEIILRVKEWNRAISLLHSEALAREVSLGMGSVCSGIEPPAEVVNIIVVFAFASVRSSSSGISAPGVLGASLAGSTTGTAQAAVAGASSTGIKSRVGY